MNPAVALFISFAVGCALAGRLAAQRVVSVTTLGGVREDSARAAHLLDGASTAGFLLRSPSSLAPRLSRERADLAWAIVAPELLAAYNSSIPFSLNDGALWAGRGLNLQLLAGMRFEWGRLRVMLLPELHWSQNRPYQLSDTLIDLQPSVPPTRHPMSSPWHAGPQSVDLPLRMGEAPIARLEPGQSSLVIEAGPMALGAATENEWWGPGIQNALILSNNAAGFPHAFLRTSRPLATLAGTFEARWMVGGLQESSFFDFDAGNDLRSIALLGLTWQAPFDRGLTLGATRSVIAPAPGWGTVFGRWFDAFADVGQPNARPSSDSTITPGRDQLISIFGRWVFPSERFEAYAEWARAEFPRSFRDFLRHPHHSQAYTLGLQWISDTLRGRNGRLRAQAELSYLHQSSTRVSRPIGSWYTSRAVVQGYTNRGQSIGAAIGPGSSSQWLTLDYLTPRWEAGAFLQRIQWLEDAHSQIPYPAPSRGWCEHDVSLLPGIRSVVRTRFGTLSGRYSSGWRLNMFFRRYLLCPLDPGYDVRNNSLTLSFTPRVP